MPRLICRTVASGEVVLTTKQAVRRVVEHSIDYDRSGALEDLQRMNDKLIDLVGELFSQLSADHAKDILNENHYETFRLEHK